MHREWAAGWLERGAILRCRARCRHRLGPGSTALVVVRTPHAVARGEHAAARDSIAPHAASAVKFAGPLACRSRVGWDLGKRPSRWRAAEACAQTRRMGTASDERTAERDASASARRREGRAAAARRLPPSGAGVEDGDGAIGLIGIRASGIATLVQARRVGCDATPAESTSARPWRRVLIGAS